MEKTRVILLMGVSGSGKTTVAECLAKRNHGQFYDADDFHPPANLAKMASGVPLDDHDRAPWLEKMRREVVDPAPAGKLAILACSALKHAYRQQLGVGTAGIALVYLAVDADVLKQRLENRPGHFMKADMLASQLATLEIPSAAEGITIGMQVGVEETAIVIEDALHLHSPPFQPD